MHHDAPPTLKTAGTGAHMIVIKLAPAQHIRHSRMNSYDDQFVAAVLTGADFNGSLTEGTGSYEANSYAPEGVIEDDGDRCLLASFEFHSVVLQRAHHGVFTFTGQLAAAESYPQEVHDRLAAGTPAADIGEMSDDRGFNYLPPAFSPLAPFQGWSALITVLPIDRATWNGQ